MSVSFFYFYWELASESESKQAKIALSITKIYKKAKNLT